MVKTLRVRTRTGWTTKPAADLPENRLTAEEVDDNFLAQEDQIAQSVTNHEGASDPHSQYVQKESGKALSDENYTSAEKTKLGNIDAEATKNATDAQLRDRSTHTGTQPLSSISDAGTAAAKDVTTSFRDTTSGRLLKVRDFGIGVPYDEDPSALPDDPGVGGSNIPSGVHYFSGTAMDKPSDWGGGGGTLLVLREWSGNGGQATYWASDRGGSTYKRQIVSGTAGPWTKVIDTAEVLGTVSQDNGTPPGGIIERGSNSDGEYVKFADGTMQCMLTASESAPIEVVFDASGYRSQTSAFAYPHSFLTPPKLVLNPTVSSYVVNTIENTGSSSRETQARFVYLSANSQSSATRTTTIFATGRWY